MQNRGDCDSKVALLATLFQYLHPEIAQRLIFVPNHALLAVALPAQPGDEQLTIEGQGYLLLEPTGPAELPLGQIADAAACLFAPATMSAKPCARAGMRPS